MSFDDGFMLGLSLGGGGGGSGGGDDIYITAYSETAISIKTIADRTAETPETTDHAFTFTLKAFKTVTTAKTSKGKSTRTWIKNIITSVANVEGTVIWTLEPNDIGTIIAVYDVGGNEILSGITNGDRVITNTPEGVALGYALAYNKEQENYTEELIEAYKNGIEDEEEIGNDEETTVNTIDLKGSGAVFARRDYGGNNYEGGLWQEVRGDYGILCSDGVAFICAVDAPGYYRLWDHEPESFTGRRQVCTGQSDDMEYYGTWYDENGNLIQTDGKLVF